MAISDMIDWLCGSANEDGGDGEVYSKTNIQKLITEVEHRYPGQRWEKVDVTGLTLELFIDLFSDDGAIKTVTSYQPLVAAARAARTLIYVMNPEEKDRHWKLTVLDALDAALTELGHPVVLDSPPVTEAQL